MQLRKILKTFRPFLFQFQSSPFVPACRMELGMILHLLATSDSERDGQTLRYAFLLLNGTRNTSYTRTIKKTSKYW